MVKSKITTRELMRRGLVTVKKTDKLINAAKLMAKKRFGGLPVVERDKLIGIVTERDIINKAVAKGKDIKKLKVSDIMTSPPKVVAGPNEDMSNIAKKMSHYDVSRIPVVENGKLIGLVTNKEVARQAPHLLNYLLEQVRICDADFNGPDAFGKCNTCGTNTDLRFKNGAFICDLCIKS